MTTLHQLYRYYDKDDVLLYVGISGSAVARMIGHKQHSEWYSNATKMLIENHADREKLELAERLAIAWENPAHNVKHNTQLNKAKAMNKEPKHIPLCDKKVSQYISGLTSAERKTFLEKTGLTRGGLNHIIAGRPVESLVRILRIIDASDGEISVHSLNPNAFPDNAEGSRRIQLFIDSVQYREQAA